ncbi:hydroxyacid dehydrogenase [soil metagenome]
MTLPSATAPASAPPRVSTESTILLALEPGELKMFLGEAPIIPGMSVFLEDTRGLKKLPAGEWLERLDRGRPEILVSCWSTPALPIDWITQPNCPLRYICHLTGSVRQLVPRRFLENGGIVTNWGSCAARQVAEHALLLTLSALRNSTDWRSLSIANKLLGTRTLFGQNVGIHGFGQVARALLTLLRPFGVKASVHAPGVPDSLIRSHDAEPCSSLLELAASCSVFIDCEALTSESLGSVDREVLAALPDDAVFVNVGRGRVVDEAALIAEAISGRLRIALDVVSEEPLDPNSPLATLPHVIHSPHLAGPTGDRLHSCGQHTLDNISRFLLGEPLTAVVDLESYDRAT